MFLLFFQPFKANFLHAGFLNKKQTQKIGQLKNPPVNKIRRILYSFTNYFEKINRFRKKDVKTN